MTHYAVSFWELRKREAAAFAAGVCCSVGVGLWFVAEAASFEPAADPRDIALKTLCRPPVTEGAMTVWTVQNGKSICWRWK